MRILIDLQACQSTGSRHRGIGRYSLALAKAMASQAGKHDICLALNGAFPEAITSLRAEFADLLPSENIKVWHSPGPVAELDVANSWRCRTAEFVREQALITLRPDIVHVTSLFEGSTGDAVSSVGLNGERQPTAVTLYDLIPLVYQKQYLSDIRQRSWYYRKLGSLKRADLLLAISESSRQEGIDWLNLNPERVVNISSAVDAHFQPRSCSDEVILSMRLRYGLIRPFVMYTGGIDLRKNIEGLIRAYAELPMPLRKQHQLAIVCSVQVEDRERIGKLIRQCGLLQDEVILTGFVPENDLPLLYQDCALFVFPSWHEGFGLPALEAMSCGAAVIAANTSSLPEVIGRSDALFDPRNDAAITQKMVDVLNDQTFHSNLCLHGLQQAKKFSWDESARISIAAFEEQHSRNRAIQGTTTVSTLHTPKPRLAFFSPLPPARSGIANYCAELLPELAEYFDIELIVDQSEIDDDWLRSNFPVRTWQWFDQHAIRYDRVLYHFGNSTYHTYMFDMLEKHPGVVVMHDFYLSGLFAHLYFKAENLAWWPNALYESHGYGALIEKRKVENLNDIIWKYPCNFSLLEKAEGVIVHSQYAVDLAKQWYGDARSVDLAKIPHLRKLPDNVDRLAARKQLGLCDEDFLLCSFGMLGEAKLNQRLLDVWLNSPLAEDVNCHLVFVGQPDEGEYCSHLLDTIKRKNKADHIKITGFADIELFRTYLMAADGAVQLRGLSRGETSGTVLDCMAYGVPTIINSNGSLRELPELGLVKLNDKFLDGQLQEKLLMLRNDPTSRRQIGTDAIEYIRENNAPKYIAKKYFTEIETFFQSNSASRLHRTLIKIADTDMPAIPSEEDLLMTAKCLSMNDEIRGVPQLLIDISAFSKKSKGVENEKREVLLRAVLTKFVLSAPAFIRIEPVITYDLEVHSVLRYARALSCSIFDLPPLSLADEVVEMRSCDIIVALVADSASIKQGLIDRFELRNNQRNNLDISEILTEPPEKWNEKIEHLVMAFWAENGLG